MSDYRPICDVWILARPKIAYYGAYPAGSLHRMRQLLGVRTHDAVLHVCSGMVRRYPYHGLGPNDRTLDLDPKLKPDFLADARAPLPSCPSDPSGWPAVLADPPYTAEDAAHYAPGPEKLPSPQLLLAHGLAAVRPGGRVGILAYQWPRPPQAVDGYRVRAVALIGVIVGYANNIRAYAVFEKTVEKAPAAGEKELEP